MIDFQQDIILLLLLETYIHLLSCNGMINKNDVMIQIYLNTSVGQSLSLTTTSYIVTLNKLKLMQWYHCQRHLNHYDITSEFAFVHLQTLRLRVSLL